MAGQEFEDFVDNEFASLRATMVKAGHGLIPLTAAGGRTA
jgi:hypothetical protein